MTSAHVRAIHTTPVDTSRETSTRQATRAAAEEVTKVNFGVDLQAEAEDNAEVSPKAAVEVEVVAITTNLLMIWAPRTAKAVLSNKCLTRMTPSGASTRPPAHPIPASTSTKLRSNNRRSTVDGNSSSHTVDSNRIAPRAEAAMVPEEVVVQS